MKKEVKEEFDFFSLFRPNRKQLEIWVDSNRKVHSKASGSITAQMKAISAMIEYIQMYASMCSDVSDKAMNVNHELIETNEELRRQLKNATNTIELVNKDMRRKAANAAQ